MGLLLLCVLGQVTYQPETPIRLDINPISFERVTVTSRYILLVDESDGAVHIFDKTGKHRAKLGEKDNVFQLPTRASWLDRQKVILVFDAAGRFFSFWRETGQLMGKRDTDFDLFFTVGNMLASDGGGYVAPVSLTHKKYLLGRFDKDFRMTNNGLEISDKRLVDIASVVTAHAAQLKVNGEERIVAAQSLSNTIQIFDGKLGLIDSMEVAGDRWRKYNFKRLEKVAKNPVELRKLKKSFSEIIGISGLSGTQFVVAFRGLNGSNYSYQVFEAKSKSEMGQPFETNLQLAGAYASTLYLKEPGDNIMKLEPYRIQR